MSVRSRFPFLLVAALALFPAALAAEEPPAPSPPAPAPGEDPAHAALKRELEETYLRVQKDFEALTGPKAAEHAAALEAALAEEARGREGKPVPAAAMPGVWTARGLLGPEVAVRLAARLGEVASARPAGEADPGLAADLAKAARLVFPEATMADNWDRHFLDLDVVRRWSLAKGASAEAGPGKKPEAGKPDPAAGTDPADMVLVPKGDLQVPESRGRGWPDPDQKAEKRTVRPFYIDRTEVSGAAYVAFLRGLKDGKARERFLPTGWKLDDKGAPAAPEGSAGLPVAGIPYSGAAAFAASLGKRLPTEDEWERAARGNGMLKYPWGPDWIEGNAAAAGRPGPSPVGGTPGDRSPFGVMDLSGNVSEFCATFPDGKPVKGLPKDTDQVVRRGGNFREPAEEATCDWRYVIGGTTRSELVGFRCAMDEKDYERRYGKK